MTLILLIVYSMEVPLCECGPQRCQSACDLLLVGGDYCARYVPKIQRKVKSNGGITWKSVPVVHLEFVRLYSD